MILENDHEDVTNKMKQAENKLHLLKQYVYSHFNHFCHPPKKKKRTLQGGVIPQFKSSSRMYNYSGGSVTILQQKFIFLITGHKGSTNRNWPFGA